MGIVHPWAQPDFDGTDSGSEYLVKRDKAIGTIAQTGAQFMPQAQDTPDMTVKVLTGTLARANGTFAVLPVQNSGIITAPTGGNSRKDIVNVDAVTGAIGVATGVPSGSPSDPDLPRGKIAVARLSLSTGQTSITNAEIDDLRPLWRHAAGGGFQPIGSVIFTFGQAAMVIDNTLLTSNFGTYEIELDNIRHVSPAASPFEIRFSFDNGTTWNQAAHEYFPGVDAAGTMHSAALGSSDTRILDPIADFDDGGLFGTLRLYGSQDSGYRTFMTWDLLGGTTQHRFKGSLKVLDSSIVNAIEFKFPLATMLGAAHVRAGV